MKNLRPPKQKEIASDDAVRLLFDSSATGGADDLLRTLSIKFKPEVDLEKAESAEVKEVVALMSELLNATAGKETLVGNKEIEELSSLHKQVVRLTFMGWGIQDIARILNISRRIVRKIRKSPYAIAKINVMHSYVDRNAISIKSSLELMGPRALALLDEYLDDPYEEIPTGKLKMVEMILDRIGYPKVREVVVDSRMSDDRIAAIKKSAQERFNPITDAVVLAENK